MIFELVLSELSEYCDGVVNVVNHREEENRKKDNVETISKIAEVFREGCLSMNQSVDLKCATNENINKRFKDKHVQLIL